MNSDIHREMAKHLADYYVVGVEKCTGYRTMEHDYRSYVEDMTPALKDLFETCQKEIEERRKWDPYM